MYTFLDKGNRSVTLKPEGTAGAMRCFIENALYNEPLPLKAYYLYSPTFRYENPQSGRLREHHQFGVEVFGAPQPTMDAEVILLAHETLRDLGLDGVTLNINSIGCPECRARYYVALKEYLGARLDELCDTCRGRFDRNPMRILDCKSEVCQSVAKDAPVMLDYLCDACAAHFEETKAYLTLAGLAFHINPHIVRGLDYYTRTVFEFISPDGLTLCGGGRYDGLCKELDGPDMPGIGFGMGLERLTMQLSGGSVARPTVTDAYAIGLGEAGKREAFRLVQQLRRAGIKADCDHTGRSFKAQMKYVGKMGFPYALILGEDELAAGVVKARDMRAASEEAVAADQVQTYLKERVNNG